MRFLDRLKKELEEAKKEFARQTNNVSNTVSQSIEKINPLDEESRQNRKSKQLQEFAGRNYGFTDEMKNKLAERHITVGEGKWQQVGDNSTAKAGATAAGMFLPSASEIKVADEDGRGGAKVLRHEALHAMWDTMDREDRQTFINLVQRQEAVDPELKSFLDFKMSSYKNRGNIDEVHAFIPEFYDRDKKIAFEDGSSIDRRMPEELRKMYGKYYDPSRQRTRDDMAKDIMIMTGMQRKGRYRW